MADRGRFITFEGGDGTGKSTQMQALALILEHFGYDVVCVREPGGTRIGEKIRDILLDPDNTDMTAEAELLLYETARAQLVEEVIRPTLENGSVVLCDRFYDSTVAYQGYGRGLPIDLIERLNRLVAGNAIPDRTILLELDAQESLARATKDGMDRIEREEGGFHERVHAGFLEQAARDERIRVVMTGQLRLETALAIYDQIADLFPDAPRERVEECYRNDHPLYFKGHTL